MANSLGRPHLPRPVIQSVGHLVRYWMIDTSQVAEYGLAVCILPIWPFFESHPLGNILPICILGLSYPVPKIDAYLHSRYHLHDVLKLLHFYFYLIPFIARWAVAYVERRTTTFLLLHCPRLNLLIVVCLNSDREHRDLDPLYRVQDNRLVFLEAESYVDDIFDWEKGANGGVNTWMFRACSFLIHLVSTLKSECKEDTSWPSY